MDSSSPWSLTLCSANITVPHKCRHMLLLQIVLLGGGWEKEESQYAESTRPLERFSLSLWRTFHAASVLPQRVRRINSWLQDGKKQVFIYIIIDNICCLALFCFCLSSAHTCHKITERVCVIWLELSSPLGLAFIVIHHCGVCFESSAAIIVKLSQHPANVITVRSAAVQGINYSLSLLHILGIKGAHLCAGACAKNVPVNWVWNIRKQR